MISLRIGEVARRTGIGIETIRYYERQGLLAEPNRKPSGYRQYDEAVIGRLQFILRAKDLGFKLSEIKELLALRFDSRTRCAHVREKAELKVRDIEEKIAALQRMKGALEAVISQCENRDKMEECPLWQDFTGPGT